MRAAGLVVADALAEMSGGGARPGSRPPSSTQIAREVLREAGARPRRSWATTAIPASICASVNDRIVHGIPAASRAARRRPDLDRLRRDRRGLARRRRDHRGGRRGPRRADRRCRRSASESLWAGLAAAAPAARLTDISHAVEASVRRTGPVRHRRPATAGTASAPRCTMDPHVLNHGRARQGAAAGRRAWRWRSSRCSPLGAPGHPRARRRLDRRHRRRLAGGALGAHRRDHRRRPVGADRRRTAAGAELAAARRAPVLRA